MRFFLKLENLFFSLNKFGIDCDLNPCDLTPFNQALIYNAFCLSKFTYAIEIMNVNIKTLNCMNVMQNNLLRYLLQLGKHNHLSRTKKI